MTGNEYQKLAARTINQGLILGEQKNHALHINYVHHRPLHRRERGLDRRLL